MGKFALIFCAFLSLMSESPQCKSESTKQEPPQIGNFSVPGKHPHPLWGFGQNILTEGKVETGDFTDTRQGRGTQLTETLPFVIFGLRDDLSLLVATPTFLSSAHGVGIPATIVQFEYAYYTNKTFTFTEQATIVANAGIPISNNGAPQHVSISSSDYFIGATYNRTYTDWLFFTSYGGGFSTTRDQINFGNTFVYQAGIGRNIVSIKDEYSWTGMVEIDGEYTGQAMIGGVLDPNSGGNTTLVTPSIAFTTQQFSFHAGVGGVVSQRLMGSQGVREYVVMAAVCWSFDPQ